MWERGLEINKQNTKARSKPIAENKNAEAIKRENRYSEERRPVSRYRSENRYSEERKHVPIQNKRKEFNMNSNEFPDLQKESETKIDQEPPSNFYAKMCKKTSEEDELRKNNSFQPGYIGFKYDKKTHETTYTRDGIHYAPMEQYKQECIIEEENRAMERWEITLRHLEARCEKESQEYYELYGELDGYANAKIEREQYEEYAKQFDIEEDEQCDMNSDMEEYYDSDIGSVE